MIKRERESVGEGGGVTTKRNVEKGRERETGRRWRNKGEKPALAVCPQVSQ